MTDDRAKRLRDLRNRTGRRRDDAARSDGNETDAETTASRSAESDTDESEKATESDTDESEAESASSTEPDSTSSSRTGTEPAIADGTETEVESVSYAESDAGAQSPAESTADSAIESAAGSAVESAANSMAEPAADPVVEPNTDPSEQQLDPALRGAIADTSAMADSIGTLGGEPTVDSSAILEETDEYGRTGTGRASASIDQANTLLHSAHNDETTVQMLEFFLNENRYAVEIDRISAIVEMKDITRFPRGPEAIDGVTDLRGEITGVLDPTVMLDIERSDPADDHYIVVLKRDDDKQKLGIRVTEVSQAVTYRESQIDETGAVMDLSEGRQHEFISGIIKKTTAEGRTSLVTWLDIDAIIEHAK